MNPLVAVAGALVTVTALPYLAFLTLYALVRPDGSPADKRDAEPTVSIVLPTYNEEQIVERKLESLLELNYPMEKVEVVVADSSDDATRNVVRNFFAGRDEPSLNLVTEDERRGVAVAVNEAVRAASGEIVFRTDCDSVLDREALQVAVANLADSKIGAVTGRQVEVLGESEVEKSYRGLQERIQQLESHLDSSFIVHGPCFAFERELFAPIGSDSLADDTEIAVRIRQKGYRIVMDPAMEFSESGISDFVKRRRRKDRRAMGLVQLLIRFRSSVGRYGLYGRVVLPFNWFFMIFSPILTAVSILLVSATAIASLGLVGLSVPSLLGVFVWLGQSDRLSVLQPLYAVFDSQVSLLVAQFKLLRKPSDGTWDLDRESREVFE